MTMLYQLFSVENRNEGAHLGDDGRRNLIAASVTCITIATAAVALRLFARRLSEAKIMADDYMIIVALVRD